MKKIILLLGFICGSVIGVNAQTGQAKDYPGISHNKTSPADRARHEAERAEKQLGLTAEQKSKWENAARERATANEPLREKLAGTTAPEEKRELQKQLKGNKDHFESTVYGFLTPEQKNKYEQMKKERRENRKHAKNSDKIPAE
jgi:hypothetical protein